MSAVSVRVRVRSGDESEDLGEGTYVGEATVFYYQKETAGEIALYSVPGDAEQEPDPADIPEGCELIISEGNPKIVLDTGETVYGCQCWWEPVDEADWPALMERLK